MTALHHVVLLTFFMSFVCVICTEAKEPWVMVKEMGHIAYQIKSMKKNYDRDLDVTTFVSLIQAPIPTTTVYGDVSKLVSTKEDGHGLSAVYEITTVIPSFFEDPGFLVTSKTESLHVELNILAADGFDEQMDCEFNDFQLQVEKRDEAESTMYKMTIRDCFCLCGFSTVVGKNSTSGFEEMRDYQHKYVSRLPDFETEENEKVCSLQVNRATLERDAVKITSLRFFTECRCGSRKENFISNAIYRLNLI